MIELGSILLPEGSWPELLDFISWLIANPLSSPPLVQESVLLISYNLFRQINILSLPPVGSVHAILRRSLTDMISDDERNARIAAVLAAIALIYCLLPSSEHAQALHDLLLNMISVSMEISTGNCLDYLHKLIFYMGDISNNGSCCS